MILTRIVGGLGNQMFQYAVGRSVSLLTAQPLKLDLTAMAKYELRSFELDQFEICAEIAATREVPRRSTKGILGYINRAFGTQQRAIRIVREQAFTFDPAILAINEPAYLQGYWQSEKYFIDLADTIRRDFRLAKPLNGLRLATLAKIHNSNAISVHVRRGDYVTNPATNAFHGTCEPEWYEAAMKLMAERSVDPTFFVFSDDPSWTRTNIRSVSRVEFVEPLADGRDAEDMYLMSCCRSHIIANSSFSWWGAWLNESPEKHVVAPAQWFRSAQHDSSDLLPENWQRL